MDRARSGALGHAERTEAVGELGGGLAGEGDGEHVGGVGAAGADPPGDTPGEHTGLARARAGDDRQRQGVAHHRPTLLLVEAVEQLVVLRCRARSCHHADRTAGV